MGLIPMQLSLTFVTIRQAHATNTFELPPSSASILFPQLLKFVNSRAYGDYLNVLNLTD